jgi:hypothetical protein
VRDAYPSGTGPGRLVFKFDCPRPRACSGRLRLRVAGQQKGFLERRWSTRNGRVRLAVSVPRAVGARPGERLPLVARLEMFHGRKPEYELRYGGIWSFDLLQVRGFER